MTVLGIDSGTNGGLCARTTSGDGSILTIPIPWQWERGKYAKALLNRVTMKLWLDQVVSDLGAPILIMIEAPQLRAGKGKMVNTLESVGSSWWQAGQLDTFLRIHCDCDIEYCTPQQWQRQLLWPYLCNVRGLKLPRRVGNSLLYSPGWPVGNREWKKISIECVRHQFNSRVQLVPPRCRVAHDGMADAVGIASYAILTLGGLAHDHLWVPKLARRGKRGKG